LAWDASGVADVIVEGKARAARLRQLALGDPQVALQLINPRDQRFQAVEIFEHKPDCADHVPVFILDRHARHDQLLAAKFHHIKQNWLAGLHHAPHQAVGNDLLDGAADRLGRMRKAECGQILLVHVDDVAGPVDRKRALAKLLQPLEQRLNGAGANEIRVADDVLSIGHGATKSMIGVQVHIKRRAA
jgi:hypothetical protein